jgi:hypothetical protein
MKSIVVLKEQLMHCKKIFLLLVSVIAVNLGFGQEKKINVYAFVAEDCPISIFMAASLKSVAERHDSKVNFYLVFPFATSTSKTALDFKSKNTLSNFTVKLDKNQRLTKKLGATITPEVVITDAEETILYRGRINDAYQQPGKRKHIYSSNDLADALDNIATGREIPGPWKRAIGCFITPENE